jgi:hypothetical protein
MYINPCTKKHIRIRDPQRLNLMETHPTETQSYLMTCVTHTQKSKWKIPRPESSAPFSLSGLKLSLVPPPSAQLSCQFRKALTSEDGWGLKVICPAPTLTFLHPLLQAAPIPLLTFIHLGRANVMPSLVCLYPYKHSLTQPTTEAHSITKTQISHMCLIP